MERRWQDWPSDNFEVEIWINEVRDQWTTLSGCSAIRVREMLSRPGPLAAFVHADIAQVSLSSFRLFVNSCGMAIVQIDEHCEHNGYDPSRAELCGEESDFPDFENGWFKVPASSAVTSDQALAALDYWLSSGSWWPGLAWSDYLTLKPTVAGASG